MTDTTTMYEAARKAALKTKRGRSITSETIRSRVEDTGLKATHPNQWGSMVRKLVQNGVLEATTDRVVASRPSANRRMLTVYNRVGA